MKLFGSSTVLPYLRHIHPEYHLQPTALNRTGIVILLWGRASPPFPLFFNPRLRAGIGPIKAQRTHGPHRDPTATDSRTPRGPSTDPTQGLNGEVSHLFPHLPGSFQQKVPLFLLLPTYRATSAVRCQHTGPRGLWVANIQGHEGCRLPTYRATRAVGCQHTGPRGLCGVWSAKC